MKKKNVQRIFFPIKGQVASFGEHSSRSDLELIPWEAGVGAGVGVRQTTAVVRLLLPLPSLRASKSLWAIPLHFLFSERLSSSLLLHKICKTIKSRRQPKRINVLAQLLETI